MLPSFTVFSRLSFRASRTINTLLKYCQLTDPPQSRDDNSFETTEYFPFIINRIKFHKAYMRIDFTTLTTQWLHRLLGFLIRNIKTFQKSIKNENAII